jgi:hypothetical protein
MEVGRWLRSTSFERAMAEVLRVGRRRHARAASGRGRVVAREGGGAADWAGGGGGTGGRAAAAEACVDGGERVGLRWLKMNL